VICRYHFKGSPVYIAAASIVGIMAPMKGAGAVLYCEEPLGQLTVDEDVQTAFGMWYVGLNNIEGEEEDSEQT
jgi:hypothetical protein